ncbi:MAG: MarR family transcriptional regulator [Proteobacteria bacterium]|uniref:MarR family winged helix-turn-helix transcriptional regulator n=1 Tax=Hyphomicrobiales TaxID=356 RepID=UPI00035E4E7F|nr:MULTISPECIES: MarR family transcriptional regulator [Phyllobacteriaceae]MCA0277294.1 MarR family transcriptional regulator [Pseudomonadota bacterium]MCX8571887.1 MarR family transcriptional regulator [Aminobacter sp. MET-1]
MSKSNKGAAMNRLHHVARLARTTLAARLLTHGFYAGQDQIMLSLHDEDGQTPGQLASRLGVRPPTITKTINRLQAQGFLEKRASDTDARQAHIYLTDTGRDAIRAVEKSVKKTEKQALRGLDKKDVKQLTKLLLRIEANLSDLAIIDDEVTGSDAEPAAEAEHEVEAEAAE